MADTEVSKKCAFMNYAVVPVNWFDVTVIIVLLMGLQSGRKRGMSEEWLPGIQWLVIVLVGALAYRPLGDIILKLSPMNRTLAYIGVYLTIAVLAKIIFTQIKKLLPEKLAGPSDVFGKYEYYLGMLAGGFRHACILIAAMAILNAPYYSPMEIAKAQAFQRDVYGSDFFPTMQSIQSAVMKESLIGKTVSTQAGSLFIAMNKPKPKKAKPVEAAKDKLQ